MTDRDLAEKIVAPFFAGKLAPADLFGDAQADTLVAYARGSQVDAWDRDDTVELIANVLRELREEAEEQARRDGEVLLSLARKAREWHQAEIARKVHERYLSELQSAIGGRVDRRRILKNRERNALRRFLAAVKRAAPESELDQLRLQCAADSMAQRALKVMSYE